MSLNRVPWILQLLCLGGILLGASVARAQGDDVSAAANAFAQAQRAELAGDSARAAELYELADGIAPTPEALRAAARAWFGADRLVPAAAAAEELLRRYGADATSRQLAEEILAKARPQLGRLQASCAQLCTLSVDGLAVSTGARQAHVVYLEPGPHTLVAHFESGETAKQRLQSNAGERVLMQFAPKPSAAPPAPAKVAEEAGPNVPPPAALAPAVDEPAQKRGLSPAYFWVGLSATAALGAVTIWSGVDLFQARDDFKSKESPTRKAFEAGESKDLRTSILIAGTAALGVTTAILAFFTEFKGDRARSETASRTRGLDQAGRIPNRRATATAWGVGADGQGGHLYVRKAF